MTTVLSPTSRTRQGLNESMPMTQRFRRLALICVSLGIFLAILLHVSRVLFLDSFATIEERDIAVEVVRARNLLLDTIQHINTTNGDYSGWDDACRFVEQGNSEFVRVNLSDAIYPKLRLNLIGFFNRDGRPIYLKAFDHVNNREISLPPDLMPHLAPGSLLLRMDTPESAVNGIVLLQQGPLLVTSRPVVTSEYRGPVRGTLVMARFFDEAEQQRLARTGQMSLSYSRAEHAAEAGYGGARDALVAGAPHFVDAEDVGRISGYGLIRDIYGKPALIAKVVESRAIFQEGVRACRLFVFWSVGIGVAAAAIIFFLLERMSTVTRTKREGDVRYRSVVERATEGIALLAPSGGAIMEANGAFCKLLGHAPAEVAGRHFSDFLAPPCDQEKPTLPEEGKTELFLSHASGRLIVVEASTGTIPFKGGTALSLLLHDVTLRMETEERLRNAKEELERRVAERTAELELETAQRLRTMEELRERDRLLTVQSRQAAMGEMIGNIAHQWRQPLNTLGLVIQQLTVLREGTELTPAEVEQSVDRAMEIIFHLSRTIDDFRFFFKPNKEKSEFDLDEITRKSVSLVEPSFNSHGITLEIETTQDIILYGYPNEFSQVLLNILLNARDALRERQTNMPAVQVRSVPERESVLVTITDNAGGIPAEIIDQVFDPYFTTKGPDCGTGLGLFMSKVIIEKNMGGSLRVRNVERGAEFSIVMNRNDGAAAVAGLGGCQL